MPPDTAPGGAAVSRLLSTVSRRIHIAHAARALTVGALTASAALAAATSLMRWPVAVFWSLLLGVAAAVVLWWGARSERGARAAALRVEQAFPESRNLVLTAGEILAGPLTVAPWMARRVLAGAGAIADVAGGSVVVPLARDAAWLVAALGALTLVAVDAPRRVVRSTATMVSRATSPTADAARVTITAIISPPSYTGHPASTVSEPAQLDIVQGSRVALTVGGTDAWSVRYGDSELPRSSSAPSVELTPAASGYFAITMKDGRGGTRLLPVTLLPDRAPTIELEAPGKDLLVPDARRSIAVSAAATDDFGLAALELRYTKVSGSGEQFEFVEGTLPLALKRVNERSWNGQGRFDLSALALAPGDALVYRAVAQDARPGQAGAATSDTFFIEVAGPTQIALPGFELPPDQERYAYSQQMVVLKLERLRPREASLAPAARTEEIATISAEQRAVRSNFIFLMGGHVEDEEEEAEQSHEIQEGRLENTARREINTAIRFMSHVEQALASGDTGAALPPARSAVEALQRAFGRNRYFLRTLAVRSRIDPTRRLTGKLTEASDWRRMLAPAAADDKARQARALFAHLLTLSPSGTSASAVNPDLLMSLAEDALRASPGDATWQQIAASLLKARDAVTSRQGVDVVRQRLQEAMTPLAAIVRQSAIRGPAGPDAAGALESAWRDEARRR